MSGQFAKGPTLVVSANFVFVGLVTKGLLLQLVADVNVPYHVCSVL